MKKASQIFLLLIAATTSSLTAIATHAHDVVVRSQPAKNGSVAAGEVTVNIEYSGRVDVQRCRLSLAAPGGAERDLTLHDNTAPNVLSSSAGKLGPGSYTVRWYVLSSDGHLTRGTIPFHVTER